MFKNIILTSLKYYQKTNPYKKIFQLYFLTPLTNSSPVSLCRFSPTCSHYLYQAISTHGILRGIYLGFKRLMRCHPWSKVSLDPVPDKL